MNKSSISLTQPCMYEGGSIKVLEGAVELKTRPFLLTVARGMGHASFWRLIEGMQVVDMGG